MSIDSVMPSNHLIFCHPLLLLPSIFPSIRVLSNESALRIRWPKDWSFSFNISLSNEYSRLISFRMDWLDLLAVQGTLKSLLQHHSSKVFILQHSAFFMVQLSHPYMTTGKTMTFLTSRRATFKESDLLWRCIAVFVFKDPFSEYGHFHSFRALECGLVFGGHRSWDCARIPHLKTVVTVLPGVPASLKEQHGPSLRGRWREAPKLQVTVTGGQWGGFGGGPPMTLRKSMWDPRGIMDEPPSPLSLGEKTEAYSPAGAALCSPQSPSGLF